MASLTLGLTTLIGLLLVWIATKETRKARMLGAIAVLVHSLALLGGLGLEPTSAWIPVVGVVVVTAQAAVLGVVALWIATRRRRLGRVVGGLVLAVLSIGLAYGMVFGPMWKVNVLIVVSIVLAWIAGRRDHARTN